MPNDRYKTAQIVHACVVTQPRVELRPSKRAGLVDGAWVVSNNQMSTTFLNAAETRKADSPVPVGDGSANPRQKITELSEKVVDSNPYSRLMCGLRQPTSRSLSGC